MEKKMELNTISYIIFLFFLILILMEVVLKL